MNHRIHGPPNFLFPVVLSAPFQELVLLLISVVLTVIVGLSTLSVAESLQGPHEATRGHPAEQEWCRFGFCT